MVLSDCGWTCECAGKTVRSRERKGVLSVKLHQSLHKCQENQSGNWQIQVHVEKWPLKWCMFVSWAGSGVVRITRFIFWPHRKKRVKQAVSVLSLSFLTMLLLFIRATYCVKVSLHLFYVFCLFVVPIKLSILAEWLARERLLWGSFNVVRRLSPQSPGRRALANFSIFVYCFIVRVSCSSALLLHNIHCTPVPWKHLSVLKVHQSAAPCGLRGCKNGPAPFPGRMSYKVTKPGLVSVLYLSMFFLLCWCLLGPLFMYC